MSLSAGWKDKTASPLSPISALHLFVSVLPLFVKEYAQDKGIDYWLHTIYSCLINKYVRNCISTWTLMGHFFYSFCKWRIYWHTKKNICWIVIFKKNKKCLSVQVQPSKLLASAGKCIFFSGTDDDDNTRWLLGTKKCCRFYFLYVCATTTKMTTMSQLPSLGFARQSL